MKYIVVDVREPDEYADSHVKGAINMPSSDLERNAENLAGISKDAPIIVYCRSGKRASASQEILQGWGYTNVTNGVSQEKVEAEYGI